MPKAVILIRHGEEPKEDETYLSKTGVERSRRLPKIFKDNSKLKKLGLPVALFAAGAKNEKSSVRSIQTLNFLSQALKIPINDSYKRDDYKDMIKEVINNPDYDDQVVLICWSHDFLPLMADKLGLKHTPDWPSGKFDRIWLLTFNKKDNDEDKYKVKLDDMPQRLMPGDDKK